MWMRRAGDGTETTVGKLSYAGWVPHDRGFVLGLPRSKWRASVSAHNRHEDSPPRSVPNPAHRKGRVLLSPGQARQAQDGFTVRAMAQMKPTISRAIAVVATTFGLPAAIRCR